MTVKLNSLARWASLASDKVLTFLGADDAERRVRINFNLEAVTTLFIGRKDGTETFLCTIGPGMDTVEFNVAGEFAVYAEDGSGVVQYQCAEFEDTHVEVADPKIFTRIAKRRSRNPELEEVMYLMQANMERRFAQQAAESDAREARLMKEAQYARAAKTSNATAPAGAGQQQVPAQKPAGEKPGEAAPSPSGGEQQGNAGGGDGGA